MLSILTKLSIALKFYHLAKKPTIFQMPVDIHHNVLTALTQSENQVYQALEVSPETVELKDHQELTVWPAHKVQEVIKVQ